MPRQSRHTVLGIPRRTRSQNQPTNPILITQEEKSRSLAKMSERLRFSFHYFDREHEAFTCGEVDEKWFFGLIDTIKDTSQLSFIELLQQRQHYDAHGHDWDKLDYAYQIPEHLWEQVKDSCYQFSITKSTGRVHGFVIGNTFYVVWLDPNHNLYPMEQHGGRRFPPRALSLYELALEQIKVATEEAKIAQEELAAFIEEFDKEKIKLTEQCRDCPKKL